MRMVFQYDEAPANCGLLVTHHLNLTFPERWIGRAGQVQWPPRSLELTPLDFCLWGVDEERSLQIESKHNRRIGRSHYQ